MRRFCLLKDVNIGFLSCKNCVAVPETPIKNLFLGGQDVYVCSVLGACVGGFMASVEASEDVYEKFKSLF